MSMVVGLVTAVAAALLVAPRPRSLAVPEASPDPAAASVPDPGWMRRWRPVLAALAGLGGFGFVGGAAGATIGVLSGVVAWWLIGRVESPAVRRGRAEVRHDLPHLVNLLASTLRSGAAPGDAVRMACAALPGAAADRLSAVVGRLDLGVDPARVWESLSADQELAPLGRALARSHRTGAPVVATIERLADELARSVRAAVEERARAVGVKAALPLGLCLLPSFLLLGIVPLVAGLVSRLGL